MPLAIVFVVGENFIADIICNDRPVSCCIPILRLSLSFPTTPAPAPAPAPALSPLFLLLFPFLYLPPILFPSPPVLLPPLPPTYPLPIASCPPPTSLLSYSPCRVSYRIFCWGGGKKITQGYSCQHLIKSLNKSHLVMHIAIEGPDLKEVIKFGHLQRSEPSHSIIIIIIIII